MKSVNQIIRQAQRGLLYKDGQLVRWLVDVHGVPPRSRDQRGEEALHAAARTKSGAVISVAGGGDTVAALNASGAAADFSYISTAGGAFLEWMEGKTLPGVAALK